MPVFVFIMAIVLLYLAITGKLAAIVAILFSQTKQA